MAKYVKISPITRIEGHLGVTTRIMNDKVATAYTHGEMFRGLEKILVGGAKGEGHGRDPRDAPVITSRTCGVCHFIHRHVSLRNIENAAGWSFPAPQAYDAYGDTFQASGTWTGTPPGSLTPRWLDGNRTLQAPGVGGGNPLPVGAQLARNIVHLVTYVYSHAAHTIALAAPDYKALIDASLAPGSSLQIQLANLGFDTSVDPVTGSFFDAFLKEAVVAQRILHEILGYLGGKAPHQQSAIPGGFSRSFTVQDVLNIKALAIKSIGIAGQDPSEVGVTSYPLLDLTGANNGLDQGRTLLQGNDWICKRVVPFALALIDAIGAAGAHEWGVGSNNFVCAPTFDVVTVANVGGAVNTAITGDAYFRGGVVLQTTVGSSGPPVRKRLDPTQEDAADIDNESSAERWVTIWEDITSGKYPYQDDFTGKPQCGGYKDDWTGPMDVDTWDEWKRKLKGPGYPGETETHPLVNYECPETRYVYTWYKATRVKDDQNRLWTVESGPLARLVVNGLDPHLNLGGTTINFTHLGPVTISSDGIRATIATLGGPGRWGSSTANRLIARLQDTLLLIDMLIGSNYSGENWYDSNTGQGGYLQEIFNNKCWLTRLLGAIQANGGVIPGNLMVDDTPPNGDWITLGTPTEPAKGCGYWDAPRGITCHFCQVVSGKLVQYQHIAGTTWNGNGRDSQGNPGPFEWSLMDYQPVSPNISLTEVSPGKYSITLPNTNIPVVERSVRITYDLYEGQSYKRYVAYDVPKHDGSDKGFIRGKGIESTSYIDYASGDIFIEFSYNSDFPDYSHVKNVKLEYYGYAGPNAVPAPAKWDDQGYVGYGYGYSQNPGKPNPINILRTIRSYDPCLACSIHVIDRKGRKAGKYEVIPVAGWNL